MLLPSVTCHQSSTGGHSHLPGSGTSAGSRGRQEDSSSSVWLCHPAYPRFSHAREKDKTGLEGTCCVSHLSLSQGFSYHTSTVLGWNSDPSGHFPWAQGYQDPAMHWVTWSKLKPSLTMAVSHPIHVCSFPSPTHITCTDIQPCLSASHTLSSQFIQQRARWVMPGASLSTIYACTSLDLTTWGRHCYRFIVQWGEQGGQIRLKNCWSVAFYQNVSTAFQLCICSLSKELAARMSPS